MNVRMDDMARDIETADFTTDAGARAFAEKICGEYNVRELATYEDFTPRWDFDTPAEGQRLRRTWKRVLNEARSLVTQAHTLHAGAFAVIPTTVTNGHGKALPHPEIGGDIDELWGMTVKELRQVVARAAGNGKTIADLERGVAAFGEKLDAVGADAKRGADAAESANRKIKPPRKDAGGRHTKHKHVRGIMTARDVAEDFNKARFQPEPGAPWMGVCDEKKINRWDADHPDAAHPNRWGYYAELRTNPDLKEQYFEVLGNWLRYWKAYRAAFGAWRKEHAQSPREDFRFKPMKRTDIEPDRIGVDARGKTFIRAKTDTEVDVENRATKFGLRPH